METLDINTLLGSIRNWETWVVLVFVAAFGVAGGVAHNLTSPSDDQTSGWGHIVLGAVASIAILFIIEPSDAVKLAALSLIAGYGGKAILNALAARATAVLAKEEVKKVKGEADVAKEEVKKVRGEANRAKEEVRKVKEAGKKAVKIGKSAAVNAQKLSQIKKGLHEVLRKEKGTLGEEILNMLKGTLPPDVKEFVDKSPEDIANELAETSNELNDSAKSFE